MIKWSRHGLSHLITPKGGVTLSEDIAVARTVKCRAHHLRFFTRLIIEQAKALQVRGDLPASALVTGLDYWHVARPLSALC